ncbi:DNA recombination protein RmuC [Uliginosibacterium aquaticum]|uniref:DNA recombination protein RmuC n=1 Tax=Uliginosibacterium aquaticum TaxID=2731212 RepID=A0ABX2IM55_9RHOO|nr:DNA recombination protein RmuC [Uliginosibacterium aquaticum]NSL55373.1 DNA recombination protein RmuC [Uliginosibacterium aquaticum]
MEFAILAVLGLLVLAAIWLGLRFAAQATAQQAQSEALLARVDVALGNSHRAMLNDFAAGLDRLGDRMIAAHTDSAERQRALVGEELRATREAMQALQLALQGLVTKQGSETAQKLAELASTLIARQEQLKTEMLAQTLEKLAEAARADRELLQDGLRKASLQQAETTESLTRSMNERLDAITGVVNQRLDEGFAKTNETFTNVMARLATIDEAQKKIGDLTVNVVSLQELLGDKKARGAFGEVQLEALVQNALPPDAYEFQCQLASGVRADCVLRLPEPTGRVAVDSKFPLENYHRMFEPGLGEIERKAAESLFKQDIKRHVDAIASKYIVAGETSDGAVMFVPAEAVFAEIHAYHPDLVSYAQARHVWIVSPTTLMAVLNTARAVLKDVETRKQIHLIKDALGKLSKDFGLFDQRMKKLADHIRLAHEDVQDVHVSSKKISGHFQKIEKVQLDEVSELLSAPDDAEG